MTVVAAAVIAQPTSEYSHIGSLPVVVTGRHTAWHGLLSRFILPGISRSICMLTTNFRRALRGPRLHRYRSTLVCVNMVKLRPAVRSRECVTEVPKGRSWRTSSLRKRAKLRLPDNAWLLGILFFYRRWVN